MHKVFAYPNKYNLAHITESEENKCDMIRSNLFLTWTLNVLVTAWILALQQYYTAHQFYQGTKCLNGQLQSCIQSHSQCMHGLMGNNSYLEW
jgi:hypothetical protein